jgi:hypothetical protein
MIDFYLAASEQPSLLKPIIAEGILIIVNFLLLCFAIIILVKIFKLIKFTDIPMLLSIVSVTLALLVFLIVLIFNVIQAYAIMNNI